MGDGVEQTGAKPVALTAIGKRVGLVADHLFQFVLAEDQVFRVVEALEGYSRRLMHMEKHEPTRTHPHSALMAAEAQRLANYFWRKLAEQKRERLEITDDQETTPSPVQKTDPA